MTKTPPAFMAGEYIVLSKRIHNNVYKTELNNGKRLGQSTKAKQLLQKPSMFPTMVNAYAFRGVEVVFTYIKLANIQRLNKKENTILA